MAAQEATSPFEKPVFEGSEVPAQLKPVSLIFEKIAAKPKPAPPVVEKVHFNNLKFYVCQIAHFSCFFLSFILQVNVTESADSNSTEENTIKVEVNTEDATPASEEASTPSETAEEPVKTADASEEL